MDYQEALQVRALRAVMQQDHEAFMRHVKRFYSKMFHVPLPEVDDLDEEHVLQAYYEEAFEQMDERDREEMYVILTETEEERAARERGEDKMEKADDEFFKNLNKEVLSGTVRGPPKPQRGPRAKPIPVKKDAPPPKPPEPPPAPLPDIHLSFGEDGNLQGIPAEWGEMDPFGSPSKKK